MHNQNYLNYNSGMCMLKQSQCQHILHAPNLCTECTVRSFLQVYWWSTVPHAPNTSHPLRHPFLGCHVGFFYVLGLFLLAFWAVCCQVLTTLVLPFVSSPMASFSGVSVKIAVVPLGCITVTTCPCKIGTSNPRPPYLTKHACSNIPA